MVKPKLSYYLYHELKRGIFTVMFKNKRTVTSIVVACRPCSSKWRILAIYWVFAMLPTVHNKRTADRQYRQTLTVQ